MISNVSFQSFVKTLVNVDTGMEYLDYLLNIRVIHSRVEDYITIVVGPKTALLQSRPTSQLCLFSSFYVHSNAAALLILSIATHSNALHLNLNECSAASVACNLPHSSTATSDITAKSYLINRAPYELCTSA